jgi:hypothetical protein
MSPKAVKKKEDLRREHWQAREEFYTHQINLNLIEKTLIVHWQGRLLTNVLETSTLQAHRA